jgi:hypothetical protein
MRRKLHKCRPKVERTPGVKTEKFSPLIFRRGIAASCGVPLRLEMRAVHGAPEGTASPNRARLLKHYGMTKTGAAQKERRRIFLRVKTTASDRGASLEPAVTEIMNVICFKVVPESGAEVGIIAEVYSDVEIRAALTAFAHAEVYKMR